MGDPAGEAADCFHLLRLAKLRFELLLAREVAHDRDVTAGPDVGGRDELDLAQAAVRALERRLGLQGAFAHEPGPDVAECEIRHQVVDRQGQRRLTIDSEEGECARVQLDEPPLVVGDQLRDDRLRKHGAEDRFRLAALRDVLDERDDVRRSAGLVDERAARLAPDDRPVLADVTPFVLPLGAEAGAHLGHIRRVALDVVRVADVTEGHLHQFRDGVAQDLRESFVDLHELPVEARQRHSDRRRAERAAEASLARL